MICSFYTFQPCYCLSCLLLYSVSSIFSNVVCDLFAKCHMNKFFFLLICLFISLIPSGGQFVTTGTGAEGFEGVPSGHSACGSVGGRLQDHGPGQNQLVTQV